MKVLHIGNFKSGIDTYIRNTVALASSDFTFVIVGGADDNSEPYIRHGKPLKQYTIAMYRALNPLKDTKAVIQAVKIIKNEKPDIVHCHSAKGGVIGRFAAFFTRRKSIYTAHAFSFLSAESTKKQKVFLALEKIARLNSVLLGCSESERLLGMEKVGYTMKNAFAWNNAIPRIQEKDIQDPDETIKHEKYVISIGRPSYQKNPLLMVEVMKRVHMKHPDVKFYLVGVGFYSPMLDKTKALIHQYGLDDSFVMVPWLNHAETLGYLKYAQVYLTTSLYEGLPIAVLEAMAMGKPIVSSDVIGNNDCVKDGENGYLLPMDADKLAIAVTRLLDDEKLREKMGKASIEVFEREFLIDKRIKDLENIYQEIAKKK
ncbi:Glycosyltransferase involved in cell wall bisynthesis [Prevotella sp. tc2-28]|uniref:glycosyltransferase n=1 Tax=Prevotella sp. tc2-28 TaxID=1761888 RepID=UPI000899B23D|nr:glycosyltransferase [Prevotella sp. tc2-28]SEA09378.1 Glycosyltransferase involved in cell wall bisynthesis [Prevotella sp. tc2-28]